MRMIRMALSLIIAAHALALPVAAEKPQKRQYKVDVDGSTFRVVARGGEVKVNKKSVFVLASVETRDKMKRAVKLATGCEIDDPFWVEATLYGKLRCEGEGR